MTNCTHSTTTTQETQTKQLEQLLGGKWQEESADSDAFAAIGASILGTLDKMVCMSEMSMVHQKMSRLDSRCMKRQAQERATTKAPDKSLQYIPTSRDKGALQACQGQSSKRQRI